MLLEMLTLEAVKNIFREVKALYTEIKDTETKLAEATDAFANLDLNKSAVRKLIGLINASQTSLQNTFFKNTNGNITINQTQIDASLDSQIRTILSPLVGKDVSTSSIENLKKKQILDIYNSQLKPLGVKKPNFDKMLKVSYEVQVPLNYCFVTPQGFIATLEEKEEWSGGSGGDSGDEESENNDWELFIIRRELEGYPGKVSESETLGSSVVIEHEYQVDNISFSFGMKSKTYSAEQINNGEINLVPTFVAIASNIKVHFYASMDGETFTNGMVIVPGEFNVTDNQNMTRIDNTITEPSVVFIGNLYKNLYFIDYLSTTVYNFIINNYGVYYRLITGIECQVALTITEVAQGSSFVKTFSLYNSLNPREA